MCFVTRCRLPALRPPGNKRRCSYQRASLCLTIRCVSVYGGGYWRMHLPTCLCVMLTDCGPTCILNPFFLQNLFHVTDVFLPPDYVTNLQKVTEPTLILTASPALYSCYLLPSPASNSQCGTPLCPVPLAPLRDSPPPDLPAHPPVEPPTALLGSRGRELGRDPSLPKWNRTNPCPVHRKSHLSAGT